jgi:hypothetical protein
MKHNFEERITALELDGFCPHCDALASLTEEELDARLEALNSGQSLPELPEPSSSCLQCQRAAARLAAMSEEELDAELERLRDILKKAKK